VIHAHDFHFALPFAGVTATPLVDTPHTELAPEILAAYRRRPDVHVAAVSAYQRGQLGDRPNVSVIPHGIPFEAFPLGDGGGGYLLFLGRLLADKGPTDAIRIAEAADVPLILAGAAQDGYELSAEAAIDGDRVRWVGRVDHDERNRLLADAIALVFPLVYPEPFGLVMLEAMACGTPVLATALGAAPEVVEQGVTGFCARSWEALAELVPAAAALDRATVRRRSEERFDVERMVDAHEALYRRIVAGRR
jgi:glycosyltransferase involved in cell wall biosynthesis